MDASMMRGIICVLAGRRSALPPAGPKRRPNRRDAGAGARDAGATARVSAREDFLIDVTGASDINKLYLVADALLTDYSSALFDYANTDRPTIYYWPDFEEYERDIRGFYFDPTTLPGDKCLSTAELIEAIGALDTWEERYGEAHRALRARFCPQDDGQAADRVIARLFTVEGSPA
jgi:CDP-glycerol glycerophosphotransferase